MRSVAQSFAAVRAYGRKRPITREACGLAKSGLRPVVVVPADPLEIATYYTAGARAAHAGLRVLFTLRATTQETLAHVGQIDHDLEHDLDHDLDPTLPL